MMKTTRQKGNYYRLKTKHWLEAHGWTVQVSERKKINYFRDRKTGELKQFYAPIDLFGADLVAMNGQNIVFVQVKAGKKNIAQARAEFLSYPFPKCVWRWIVSWKPKAREPEVEEI